MSHHTLTMITCDWPECYGRIKSFGNLTEARKAAVDKHGWKNVAALFDFCGTKEQAESWDGDRNSLHGHAAQEDHMPVVKAAGKGRIKLSCLCRWKYVSPYAWDRDTTYRSTANSRWSNHMREVLEAAKATSTIAPA